MAAASSSVDVRHWIQTDETAAEALNRIFTETRPFVPLPPPLHRLPLRAGNVLEIAGPSPSAKSHILMQAAIDCILPKEYGGMGRLVMFIDLDCRFDISRFAQLLKHKLLSVQTHSSNGKKPHGQDDKEIFAACMRRFLYNRCYCSFEFLAVLKTFDYELQKEKHKHKVGVRLLMIDRKSLSLQTVWETVVQEIQRLLLVYPMLVLATKTAILGHTNSTNEVMRKWSSEDAVESTTVGNASQNLPYREFMPSVWRTFVTHRVLVRTSDNNKEKQDHVSYSAEWLSPSLKPADRFIVTDGGVFLA